VACEHQLVLQVKIFCLVIDIMEEQRVAIKFSVKAGKSAVETIELINTFKTGSFKLFKRPLLGFLTILTL